MEKEPKGRDIYFTKYDNLIPVETLLGVETPERLSEGRCTGRTFRIMLETIYAASANPGQWIRLKDHSFGSEKSLAKRIKGFLEKSDMASFFQFTDSYSEDELIRRYYIRFSALNYKNNPYIL